MDQLLQIGGALMILAAFVAAQLDVMSPHALAYLWLNLLGSAVLTIAAILGSDWGFLLLESVWAAVSAWGLLQVARSRQREIPG
jgi:hypothetical protein